MKSCKLEHLKCRNCEVTGHATLLCRKGDNKEGKKVKPPDTSTHQTVTGAEEDPEPAGEIPPALPETTSNLGMTTPASYDLLESEAYLLSRDGNAAPVFTCVGEVTAIDSQGREVQAGALFDHCSSDSWCTAEFARKVRAKRLEDWVGTLRTIRGTETVKLPAVEIKVYNFETGQIVKIEALVTRDIGTKPVIDEPRFTRLCNAFSISPNQIDRLSGPCQILIGVKAQSLQISKLARFKSAQFENVGIYTSPLLAKILFIRAETTQNCWEFLRLRVACVCSDQRSQLGYSNHST